MNADFMDASDGHRNAEALGARLKRLPPIIRGDLVFIPCERLVLYFSFAPIYIVKRIVSNQGTSRSLARTKRGANPRSIPGAKSALPRSAGGR